VQKSGAYRLLARTPYKGIRVISSQPDLGRGADSKRGMKIPVDLKPFIVMTFWKKTLLGNEIFPKHPRYHDG
jgi:hypothetical protein